MLYGAPCWEPYMVDSAWRRLEVLWRRIGLKTTCAYNSVSHSAVAVVAAMPPLRLKAKERTDMYNLGDKENRREDMMRKWQDLWESSTTGRWTFKLIPYIQKWVERTHGDVNFQLTQVLTGHGSFGSYLQRIKRRVGDECQLCG